MSLNKVNLTAQLIADLYQDTLVETSVEQSAAPTTDAIDVPKASYHALGGNGKNILVVVAKTQEAFLPDEELTFLTSILSACKLSLGDVALVNYERLQNKDRVQLMEHFSSRSVLLFNIDPLTFGLPINFPTFQVQAFNNGTYVYAPDLGVIEKDVNLKKQLWNSLKNLFSL